MWKWGKKQFSIKEHNSEISSLIFNYISTIYVFFFLHVIFHCKYFIKEVQIKRWKLHKVDVSFKNKNNTTQRARKKKRRAFPEEQLQASHTGAVSVGGLSWALRPWKQKPQTLFGRIINKNWNFFICFEKKTQLWKSDCYDFAVVTANGLNSHVGFA